MSGVHAGAAQAMQGLRRMQRRAERRRQAWAMALVAPLALFLLAVFVLPIGML